MFVFGEPLNATDSKLYKYEEIQLARRIMSYWSNFAKYGYVTRKIIPIKKIEFFFFLLYN